MGGTNGEDSFSIVEVYDPKADRWEEVASMPTARNSLASAVVEGKIYAIGGYNDISLATVEVYDPQMNRWGEVTSMLTARFHLAGAVVAGKIYAIGGSSDGRNVLSIVEEFTPNS